MAATPDARTVAQKFMNMFTPPPSSTPDPGTSGLPNKDVQVAQNQSAMGANNTNTPSPTTVDPNADPNAAPKPDDTTVKSPLDQFTTLFDNVKTDGDAEAPPSITFTPENLQTLSDGISFTSNLSPEMQQQLADMGDQGKVITAMMEAVGKQAYSTALNHASVITNKAVGARSEFDLKGLGSQVRKHLVTDSLASTSNADHPVVQSMKQLVADKLQAQNPTATTDWVNKQVHSFMGSLSEAQGGAPANLSAPAVPDDVNWGDWLKEGPAVPQ